MPDSLRSLQARVAAYTMHSRYSAVATTEAARKAFDGRFADEVDPDGTLRKKHPEDFLQRVECARRAYFAKLQVASVKARQKRARSKRKQL